MAAGAEVTVGAVVGTGVLVGCGTGVSVGEEVWVGVGVSVGLDDEVGAGVGVFVGDFFIVGTFLGSVGDGSKVGERYGSGVIVGSALTWALLPKITDPPPKRRIIPNTPPPINIMWFW